MPRGLVLSVAPGGVVAEDRQNDLRLETPDDAHSVFEQHLFGPLAERLLERPGVTEVVGAGEVLARPVDLARREELLRAVRPAALIAHESTNIVKLGVGLDGEPAITVSANAEIGDHVDYLSVRPDPQRTIPELYTHPAQKKQ